MQPSPSSVSPATRRLWLGFIIVLAAACVGGAYGMAWLLVHAVALAKSGPIGATVVMSLGAVVAACALGWVRDVAPVIRHSWRPIAGIIKRVSSAGLASLRNASLRPTLVPSAARVPDMATLLATTDKPPVSACTPHEAFRAPFRLTPSYQSMQRFSPAPPAA